VTESRLQHFPASEHGHVAVAAPASIITTFVMPSIIRPEEPRDAAAIEQVTIDAFMSAPYTDHTEQFIVRELRRANALAVSLVAEVKASGSGLAFCPLALLFTA
jgi:hypothetical protein